VSHSIAALRQVSEREGAVQQNATLASYKIGIFSSDLRTSGLEALPKGALTVLPMQSGASKGSTQGASQDSNWKYLRWEKNRQGALEVLPNANECDQWFSKVRL